MVRGSWHAPLANASRHVEPLLQANTSWQQIQRG
jgi:hypothetical protein